MASDEEFRSGEDLTIVFVIGAPGAGKGTLCKRFAKEHSFFHLSVGDHLRALCSSDDTEAEEAFGGISQADLKSALEARQLLGAITVVRIVRYKIEYEEANGWYDFVVDGFPRSDESAKEFEQKICYPRAVLLFDSAKNVAKVRFLNRKREVGDNERMFERRFAEFEVNNKVISSRYVRILKRMSWIREVSFLGSDSTDKPQVLTDGDVEDSYGRLIEQMEGIGVDVGRPEIRH